MNSKKTKTVSKESGQQRRHRAPPSKGAGSGRWRRLILPGFLALVSVTVIVSWFLLQPESRSSNLGPS